MRIAAAVGAVVVASSLLAPSAQADVNPPPLTAAQVQSAVDQLDTLVPQYLAQSGVPGAAVAVVYQGRLLYAKGFGVRSTATSLPVTADTVFQVASVSKPIGASVIAAAVKKKIVTWDDPVAKHLPWFRLSDSYVTSHATIGDMYAMRSGLPGEVADQLELFGYTRRQILTSLRYVPLDPFRISYAYTDFGLTVGGQAVAEAAHKPWAVLSDQLLYRPLGMTSTSSTYAGFLAQPNRASLHVKENGTYVPRYFRNADAQSPAGGVSSNVMDIAKWMTMVLANGEVDGTAVVDPAAQAAANTTQIRRSPVQDPATSPQFYGYGMNINVDPSGRMSLGHSGSFTAGAGTNVQMVPGSNLGIVTLANASAGLSEAINASFVDFAENGRITFDWLSAYQAFFSGTTAANPAFNPPSSPKAGRPAAQLVGRYANDFYGTVVVTARNGKVALNIGPKRYVLPLVHWSGDTYVATLSGQTPPTKFWVTFDGPPGPASSVNIGISDDATATLPRQD